MILNPSFWAGKRVLLTGHTGFKGSWLSLWLSRLGAEVWGYALAPEGQHSLFVDLGLAQGQLHHHLGDLRDLDALREVVHQAQPEVVLHLAAQPLVPRSYRDPLGTWATNVQGSLNLLDALSPLQHPCSVLMVTTDKVYANREWDYGYREDDRLGGQDPYSASKAAAELAIASWRNSFCGLGTHQTPHLKIATARAGNVIGGGDWSKNRLIPDIFRAYRSKKKLIIRNQNHTRPWQHVLDVLDAYLKLTEYSCYKLLNDSWNVGPKKSKQKNVIELVNLFKKKLAFEYRILNNKN